MEQGKNILHMVQLANAPLGAQGRTLANETDSSHSISNGIVDEMTKTGRVVAYGNNSETIELSMYALRGDKGQNDVLNAIRKKIQLKIWKIDTVPDENGHYDVDFGYGIVESYEEAAGSEGFREVSTTVQIIGEMQSDKFESIPQEMIDYAAYGFELPGEKTGEFGGAQQDSVPVTNVSVTPPTVSVAKNATSQLSVVVTPPNASNTNVTFITSDASKATVSATGLVTGVAVGSATITVTSADGKRSATVAITVTA